MDEMYSRLANCFSVMFPRLSAEEIPQATPESVEGWDSMASVTLLLMIEEEFGIDIDMEAVEELTSFELILAYLQKKRAARYSGNDVAGK